MRYLRKYNEQAKSVRWKYFDPTRRIATDSIITGHWQSSPWAATRHCAGNCRCEHPAATTTSSLERTPARTHPASVLFLGRASFMGRKGLRADGLDPAQLLCGEDIGPFFGRLALLRHSVVVPVH